MDESIKTVGMVGLGYIGLPTAAILASRGLQVIGIDVNQHAVDTINKGAVHIVEPDLDIVVRSVVTTGNLRATTTAEPADAFLVAVPTPFNEDRTPDLSFIRSAAMAIAPVLKCGNLVVLESTSPVGTTEKLAEWLATERPDLSFPQTAGVNADIQVAYCPERVLPGQVLQELVNNDRVIGGMTSHCAERASTLYQIFVKGECIVTSARTAELCKLTENAYRDVNIAFANEMSLVCDPLEVNVWELIELANRHPRVNILTPGPGVGGHCIAIDPWFIVDSAPELARLIRTAREVNDSKPEFVVAKIREKANRFKTPRIACFGLSFKANIDDLRESPALQIVNKLASESIGTLLIVEPNIRQLPPSLADNPAVELVSLEYALKHSDIVVGLVDHREFKVLDRTALSETIVIDTRGMWR
ncbi:UDP-N-acetyl-D-mannosamine dehydrogenase [Granulosicoccus antarcticus]|uniref:UDP-N-acetyl-D-mannosamine dehydrogenase n=1 Tax=Granulosicoccus antarcticus IMCC3135 TaxID=1192854 RepID=A0A2Z2NXP5_9GAMM|nr:UDP-N-acetyl-D-mannosamine dehydrogenase [Granulosicoccus antarcticus]ASJ74518.1 UDP-N-acetyl-D-mannosamine dehydrogenase [Granulosicoccus antarcticus IMCC3135]